MVDLYSTVRGNEQQAGITRMLSTMTTAANANGGDGPDDGGDPLDDDGPSNAEHPA